MKGGSVAATTVLALIAGQASGSVEAADSCEELKQGVKELCTRTLESEPVWMSCAYYYSNAFGVLRKGGDEKWTLDEHCRSLTGTMARVRERKQERGESAEAVAPSDDPACPAERERLVESCLGLLDLEELPAESETQKCAGRLGLFERGMLEGCEQ